MSLRLMRIRGRGRGSEYEVQTGEGERLGELCRTSTNFSDEGIMCYWDFWSGNEADESIRFGSDMPLRDVIEILQEKLA